MNGQVHLCWSSIHSLKIIQRFDTVLQKSRFYNLEKIQNSGMVACRIRAHSESMLCCKLMGQVICDLCEVFSGLQPWSAALTNTVSFNETLDSIQLC